jgi:hypothetical protein
MTQNQIVYVVTRGLQPHSLWEVRSEAEVYVRAQDGGLWNILPLGVFSAGRGLSLSFRDGHPLSGRESE